MGCKDKPDREQCLEEAAAAQRSAIALFFKDMKIQASYVYANTATTSTATTTGGGSLPTPIISQTQPQTTVGIVMEKQLIKDVWDYANPRRRPSCWLEDLVVRPLQIYGTLSHIDGETAKVDAKNTVVTTRAGTAFYSVGVKYQVGLDTLMRNIMAIGKHDR